MDDPTAAAATDADLSLSTDAGATAAPAAAAAEEGMPCAGGAASPSGGAVGCCCCWVLSLLGNCAGVDRQEGNAEATGSAVLPSSGADLAATAALWRLLALEHDAAPGRGCGPDEEGSGGSGFAEYEAYSMSTASLKRRKQKPQGVQSIQHEYSKHEVQGVGWPA
eukprot:1154868-Pelagomonas_calceolata.AAC.4